MEDKLSKIKNHWENPETVSLLDKNLRQLEINTAKSFLKPGDNLINIGCGDGSETIEFAKVAKSVVGVDNSDYLLGKAKAIAAKNTSFQKCDILDKKTYPSNKFDAAISIRVLINLPTWELQKQAILNIKEALKPHGRYIMVEDTIQGTQNMNLLRQMVGLEKVDSPRWYNLFFDTEQFFDFLSKHFKITQVVDFNLYYFLTRVYTQMFAEFTGYGKDAKADPIFAKADDRARMLFEKLGNKVKFNGMDLIGQECCIVLERL